MGDIPSSVNLFTNLKPLIRSLSMLEISSDEASELIEVINLKVTKPLSVSVFLGEYVPSGKLV